MRVRTLFHYLLAVERGGTWSNWGAPRCCLLFDPLRLRAARRWLREQHVAEHAELCAVLVDANATSDTSIGDGVLVAVLDRLIEHMACEEKAFLGEDVLRDDGAVVDQFSG